jgi:hypothetical protein
MIEIEHLVNELGLQGVTGEFEKASESDIAKLESQIGATLPREYREFLGLCGPCLFENDVVFDSVQHSPWTSDGAEMLDVLYGVSSDPGFDVGSVNTRLKNDLPKQVIAVGHDPGSNLILMSIENGDVQFLDKDTGKTYLIAQNFGAFLQSFRLR